MKKKLTRREIIVLLGKPGSGKGTQAAPLSKVLGIPAISMGKLLRSEMKKRTVIGRKVARYVDAGKLVPNRYFGALLKRRFAKPDVKDGAILDGFPRNLDQAVMLEEVVHVTHAFLISITDREVIKRLQKRGREDDRPKVIRERMRSFRHETLPVLKFYRFHRVLRRVDGMGTVAQVSRRMVKALRSDDRHT